MKLLEEFGIKKNNNKLYETAFTHTSYANENTNTQSYERLEFLGDAVIELVISEYLYKNKELEEGYMTKVRASWVCENSLYENALAIHLEDYVKVGKGEELSGGKLKKTILADVFEAFVGAIYLDQGLDKVKEFLHKTLIQKLDREDETYFMDYKSMMQELIQVNVKTIEYELIDQVGPPHDRVFTVALKIDGIVYGVGVAKNKKDAEQAAAKDALSKRAK